MPIPVSKTTEASQKCKNNSGRLPLPKSMKEHNDLLRSFKYLDFRFTEANREYIIDANDLRTQLTKYGRYVFYSGKLSGVILMKMAQKLAFGSTKRSPCSDFKF